MESTYTKTQEKANQTTTAIADNEGLPFKTLHVWSSAYPPNRLNHGYPIRLKSLMTLRTVGLYVSMFLKQNVVHVDLVPVSHCHNALTLYCTCLSYTLTLYCNVFDCHTLWPCICFWSSYGLTLGLFLIVIHFDLVSVSDCHMVWPCTCFWLSYTLTLCLFLTVVWFDLVHVSDCYMVRPWTCFWLSYSQLCNVMTMGQQVTEGKNLKAQKDTKHKTWMHPPPKEDPVHRHKSAWK